MKWTREPGSLGWRVKVESEPLSKPILERWEKNHPSWRSGARPVAKKICNNMILGVTTITTCEAFVLAEKLGLSHQALEASLKKLPGAIAASLFPIQS
jgi:3-hydroxyisobutyrate dehydrogenase-like beta-hydroxyacid dehydrogenase